MSSYMKGVFTKDGPKPIREKIGESQHDFWGRLGMTQSGGSRYETGRTMSGPLRILFGVVYLGEKLPKRFRL